MPLLLALLRAQEYLLKFVNKEDQPLGGIGVAFRDYESAICYTSDEHGTVTVPTATLGEHYFYPCSSVSAQSRALIFNTTRFELSELRATNVIKVCQMFKLTVELPNKLVTLHLIDKSKNSIQEKQAT